MASATFATLACSEETHNRNGFRSSNDNGMQTIDLVIGFGGHRLHCGCDQLDRRTGGGLIESHEFLSMNMAN